MNTLFENVKKQFLLEVKQGKLRNLLGVPEDKQIEDVYTSGKKLAEDLLKKVDYESAIKM